MSSGQIAIAPIIPFWLVLLLLLLGLGLILHQYLLIRKRVGGSKALMISLLRLGVLSLLVSFFLNPAFLERRKHTIRPPLAVLVDSSQSMGLTGNDGTGSRLDQARSVLLQEKSALLKALSEKFEVRLFAFGESLRPIEAGDLPALKGYGRRGDLTDSLKKLSGKSSIAILLSDGNVKWEGSASTHLPVFSLAAGDSEGYRDLLIKAVKAPLLAFRGREVVIDVTVKAYGYAGLTLPVILKDGSNLLTAKNVRLHGNPAEVTVPLSFTPEKIGSPHLSVSIPSQYGESLTSNNGVNLSLKVIKDKIRVLMISGSPSLSYRLMRTAFKNDPSVDLLSFVILRTPSDVMNVPLQEQSLIPFPVETLFSKELKDFDLLIFDNFPYNLYLQQSYIENLKGFVKEGGGFAVIGGPFFSREGGYEADGLGEILPVRFTGKEAYQRDFSSGVKLSRAGMVHPITCLSPDEGDNAGLWKEMAPLDGINLLEVRRSGTVLLESNDGTSRPILTVGDYGKGRVLTLSTDFSWKWYMGLVARGRSNVPYLLLMERMVRWLTRDPSLDPIQIILPQNAGSAGRESEVRIKMRNEGSSFDLKGKVSLHVFNPEGMKIESQLKPASRSGEFTASFWPEKGGAYRIRVDSPAGHQEESLVIPVPGEDLDGAPDHDRLRTASLSTGGKFLSTGSDLLREVEAYAAGRRENHFTEERSLILWGRPYSFAFILLLLTGEWYLRRKWGLR